jgi:hypothetical protein
LAPNASASAVPPEPDATPNEAFWQETNRLVVSEQDAILQRRHPKLPSAYLEWLRQRLKEEISDDPDFWTTLPEDQTKWVDEPFRAQIMARFNLARIRQTMALQREAEERIVAERHNLSVKEYRKHWKRGTGRKRPRKVQLPRPAPATFGANADVVRDLEGPKG